MSKQHYFLEEEIISEAGEFHQVLDNLFDKMRIGENPQEQISDILRRMKRTVSENCYDYYLHTFEGLCGVMKLKEEMKERKIK